ncbi:MAG: Gfo/Idh/MocA family oxidoreductase [Solirubrobacterales bacterium]
MAFRWAVVGIGRHSRLYVIPAIAGSAEGSPAALVTSKADSARRFAEPFGEPKIYATYEEALADPEVDGVFLVTPNDVHRAQVEAAAAAGKHVLCEKPLATTVEDAAAMVSACREAGVVLGTGFHLRHNLVHEHARALIRAGRIGAVRFASVRYAHATAKKPGGTSPGAGAEIPPVAAWRKDPEVAGGGAFVGTGSHAIDLLRFLTDAELETVEAVADGEARAESGLVFVARLSGGAIAAVHGGDLPFPVNETTISGTAGSIVCRGSVGNVGGGTLTVIDAEGEEDWAPPTHDVYLREVDSFVAAVREGREADASGLDGLRCQEAIEAVYAAVAAGGGIQVEHALDDNHQVKE